MLFQSKQIRGEGRGHQVGFPTINLIIPDNLLLDEGIYASWITIDHKVYKGALHYGAIPTFDQSKKTMEVYLLDVTDENVPDTEDVLIEIDIVERLRGVRKFDGVESLAFQIDLDVKNVRSILK
jgi:riboflavin kinase/FMN adenylyltransferase